MYHVRSLFVSSQQQLISPGRMSGPTRRLGIQAGHVLAPPILEQRVSTPRNTTGEYLVWLGWRDVIGGKLLIMSNPSHDIRTYPVYIDEKPGHALLPFEALPVLIPQLLLCPCY